MEKATVSFFSSCLQCQMTKCLLTFSFFRYKPSVFVLKPGQTLHIGKGCLHAFRKLSSDPLDENDCHYELRNAYIASHSSPNDINSEVCISFAWDWQKLGSTAHSIQKELAYMNKQAEENCEHCCKSNSVGEYALATLAEAVGASQPSTTNLSCQDVATGILPSFMNYVKKQQSILSIEIALTTDPISNDIKVQIAGQKDSADFMKQALYSCCHCQRELSNAYWCCDKCIDNPKSRLERTLFCHSCFSNGKNFQKLLDGHKKLHGGLKGKILLCSFW